MVGLMVLSAVGSRAATPGPTLWYLTRTTAVAAYIVLTLSVIFGILRPIARTAAERLPWTVDELHSFLATLTGVLVLGHLLTILLDSYVPFTLTNFLVPGQQPYRQPTANLGVNLGVFALYALVLVLLSSWVRRRIPYRAWRGVHYTSFIVFTLVTLHGLLVGSDASEAWLRAVYAGAAGAVGFLTLMRLFGRQAKARQQATARQEYL
jgi:sulfoxide reductase heme-binding subunit YedZ